MKKLEWNEEENEDYIDKLLKSEKRPKKGGDLYQEIKRENRLKPL